MGLRRIRRAWQRYAREFDLPPTGDAFQLAAAIGAHPRRRGRPLHLLAMPLDRTGPCGLWIATSAADYIVYESQTSPSHQRHIIAHEIGHLVLEHATHQTFTTVAREQVLGHLDPAVVQRMLGRSAYDVREEREAETVASILLEGAIAPAPPEQELPELLQRIHRSLAGPRG